MTQQMPSAQGRQVQQPAGQGMQGSQQMGLRYQDATSPQDQAAVDTLAWAIQVCEWCADECIQLADPNMTECIRLCRDVSDLGRAALGLMPRRSRHAQQHLQTVLQAVQACAQECGHHQHTHCQECAQALGQAAATIEQCMQGGQVGSQMSSF